MKTKTLLFVLTILIHFVSNGQTVADSSHNFNWEIWKTIKIGTYTSVDEIKNVLGLQGYKITDQADALLNAPDFKISKLKQEIKLVMLTRKELGLQYKYSLREFYAAAIKKGLSLCPPEIGPALREQYKNQPENEWIRIAMEPITPINSEQSFIFFVSSGYGNLALGAYLGALDGLSWGDNKYVFCLVEH
jgi:hypothetical protein